MRVVVCCVCVDSARGGAGGGHQEGAWGAPGSDAAGGRRHRVPQGHPHPRRGHRRQTRSAAQLSHLLTT